MILVQPPRRQTVPSAIAARIPGRARTRLAQSRGTCSPRAGFMYVLARPTRSSPRQRADTVLVIGAEVLSRMLD